MNIQKKVSARAALRRATIYHYLLFGCLVCLSSCFSVKPGTAKGGQQLYEDFFVGPTGTQYFIKPLTFTGENDTYFEIDMTFRFKDEIRDSATVNISFFHPEVLKTVDSLKMENAQQAWTLDNLDFMFVERAKEGYKCRFTATIELAALTESFLATNWDWTLYRKDTQHQYQTPKRTRKHLAALDYALFTVMRTGNKAR